MGTIMPQCAIYFCLSQFLQQPYDPKMALCVTLNRVWRLIAHSPDTSCSCQAASRFQVSGYGCQENKSPNPETSCETSYEIPPGPNSEQIERRTSNVQHRTSNIDGFVKSLKTSFGVIPAKAGIQCFQIVLDACLRRHDGISDFLRVCQCSMFIF